MALWKRIAELDSEGRPKIVPVDLAMPRAISPTAIFLTGFSTLDRTPGYIAGGLKRMEEMLEREGYSSGVQFMAWAHRGFRTLFNMAAYNFDPRSYASKAVHGFAEKLFTPLILDEKGTPLEMEDARKNLRSLTFLAYSSGTVAAQEVYNGALKFAQESGYSKEQARALLQEVVLVSVGNVSRPTREQKRFTTLYLVAKNDLMSWLRNHIWPSFREWRLLQSKKQLTITPLSKTSLYISAPIRPEDWEIRDGKNGEKTREKIDMLLPECLGIRSYHELPYYLTPDDKMNDFSRIVIYALNNAVRRTATITPEELLQPTLPVFVAANDNNHPLAITQEYRERIAKALHPKPPKPMLWPLIRR